MAHHIKLYPREDHICPAHDLSESKILRECHLMREPRKLTKT